MELAHAAAPGTSWWSGSGECRPRPAAVAQPVMDLVTGPLRPATVLAAYSAAVILACDAPAGDGEAATRVVTLLAAEGSGVPNGVRIGAHAAHRPFAHLAPGDAAFVGGGGLRLVGLAIRCVRTVRTAVPLIRPAPWAATAIAAAAGAWRRGVDDRPVAILRDALAAGVAAQLRSAVIGLVGLGSGSTPGGDDVLCGTLAGLHATGRAVLAAQVAAAALPDLAARTPLVSADLLRLAAAGHACAEATAVLRASAEHRAGTGGRGGRDSTAGPGGTAGPDGTDGPGGTDGPAGAPGLARSQFTHALRRLLAIGHTSGADLATGLALGLAVPAQHAPTPPGRGRSVGTRT